MAGMFDQDVLLRSSDGEFSVVPGPVAVRSKLMKGWMANTRFGSCAIQRIFQNVPVHSRFLKMVLQFCTYRTECKMAARRSLPVSTESIEAWNEKLLADLDFEEMMELHEAASCMQVKKLHVLTTRKINEFITAMPAEEYLRRHNAFLRNSNVSSG